MPYALSRRVFQLQQGMIKFQSLGQMLAPPGAFSLGLSGGLRRNSEIELFMSSELGREVVEATTWIVT